MKTDRAWAMPNMWITATQRNGEPLEVKNYYWSSGDDQYLPVSVWIVASDIMKAWDYPGQQNILRNEMASKGISDLTWDDARRALYAAEQTPKKLEFQHPFPSSPADPDRYPEIVVPVGFEGPVYIITDPLRGTLPELDHGIVRYHVPASGVLRVKLTEEMSRMRSWPLVFDAKRTQLWLRPLARSNGIDVLPITSFLVCRSEQDHPEFPEHFTETLLEQLAARGVTDLSWPEVD